MKTISQKFTTTKFNLTMLIILLANLFAFSQNDSIPSYKKYTYYNDPIDTYFKKVSFRIGGGVLIPQSGLKDYFGVSPMIELGAVFPLKKRKSIELAVQFVIPNQKTSFKYVTTLETINAKATFMFNPMLRFKKNLLNSYKSELNVGLGLGASVITTDARNPFYEGKKDDKKYEMITSFLASPLIEYTQQFSNNERLTIGFNLQYSPYKIEGALQEDIGSLFYVPRIAYRF